MCRSLARTASSVPPRNVSIRFDAISCRPPAPLSLSPSDHYEHGGHTELINGQIWPLSGQVRPRRAPPAAARKKTLAAAEGTGRALPFSISRCPDQKAPTAAAGRRPFGGCSAIPDPVTWSERSGGAPKNQSPIWPARSRVPKSRVLDECFA